jgi:hypothetical protein
LPILLSVGLAVLLPVGLAILLAIGLTVFAPDIARCVVGAASRKCNIRRGN